MSIVPASDSPPMPTADQSTPWSKAYSTALVSKLIAKASAGTFRSAAGRIDKSAPTGVYCVRVWDLADVPADATATSAVNQLAGAIVIEHSVGSHDYWEIEQPNPGVSAATGIVVGLSTTEYTQTAAGNYMSVTGVAFK
jgi:hypothetical protein